MRLSAGKLEASSSPSVGAALLDAVAELAPTSLLNSRKSSGSSKVSCLCIQPVCRLPMVNGAAYLRSNSTAKPPSVLTKLECTCAAVGNCSLYVHSSAPVP